MLPALSTKDLARFNSKINSSGDCHIWTGTLNFYGYGQFSYITDVGRKIFMAHRISYELNVGEIPPNMHIDHMCHTKACVNPKHLRVATPKQNQENRPGARRGSSSGVRGVYWDNARNKWGTCITHNNKKITVGRFDSVADAEEAVKAKRLELFTYNILDRAA